MFTFVVCSVFKNESHILEEWINHYLLHGVDHFYLVNDFSTDNFLSIIEKYKEKITLYHNDIITENVGRQCLIYEKFNIYINNNHNIHINYRCKESHHANLKLFNSSNNIHILPYSNIGYLLWQGTEVLKSGIYIEDILCNMFNKFLKIHTIPIILEKFEYKDIKQSISDHSVDLKNLEDSDYL
jgi:hypothetical protein